MIKNELTSDIGIATTGISVDLELRKKRKITKTTDQKL